MGDIDFTISSVLISSLKMQCFISMILHLWCMYLKFLIFYLFPVFQCKKHLPLFSGQSPFLDSSLYAISDADIVNCPNFKRHEKADW